MVCTAGVSGILSGIIRPKSNDWLWRVTFLFGLLVAATILLGISVPASASLTVSDAALLVPAGLCTGFGARLGGGCTSGHGVCGVSRLSSRSVVATLTFIAAGAATVFLSHHVLGGHG